MIVKLLTEHHLEFLSLKGGCTGSSECTLVKKSNWKSHVTAHLIHFRLFETNDEVRGMFAKVIKNLNVTDLRESKELENHVKQVMYTLDEAISSLEDVDFVVNMLHSVGKGHRRLVEAGGFNPNVFWVRRVICTSYHSKES